MRSFLLLLLFTVACSGQDAFILNWVEGDLDGDKIPERVLLLSSESGDPSNASSKKVLEILKRKGNRYTVVYRRPFRGALYPKMHEYWRGAVGTPLWGLNYVPATASKKAHLLVVVKPNSSEFFTLMYDGKSYQSGPDEYSR